EVWSDHFEKWLILDPDYNLYYEIKSTGLPANAYEVRQSLFGGAAVAARPADSSQTIKEDEQAHFYANFAVSLRSDLLRQNPCQAQNKDELKTLLQTKSGGVIFSTIQKFLPDKKVSQYDFIDEFARHLHDALPNASFIGFTGTPIEPGTTDTVLEQAEALCKDWAGAENG
ncbi:MAG: type restriction enzyme subunit, partial [Acidobacteriota bacterium]|nr:type restriction enzyme subunit [Acidobacteriota bacterium]